MSCAPNRLATAAKKIKVEENGKSATFINDNLSEFFKIRLDGGVVNNKRSADYVVVKRGVGGVVVELKGTDIEHAVDQIEAAFDIVKSCTDAGGKGRVSTGKMLLAGLIICSRYPRVDSMYQKKLKQFVAKYKRPIHCVCKRGEFVIERVLEFGGPR